MSDSDAIAVIIGRAGSRGLPGKNARTLAGRPVIAYSIDAARAADTVGRIVVSTDAPDIARAAGAMDVPVIDRPAHLADDTAPVSGAVRHAVETIRATEDVVVILYANVPVRPDGLIDRAVRRLRESGADSVQSYAAVEKHHPYWMVALDEDGHIAAHHPNRIDRRQDLPPLFLPDGGVIAVARASLLAAPPGDPHAFLGRDRRGIETAPGSVIDIDGPHDLLVAEAMLERPMPAGAAR